MTSSTMRLILGIHAKVQVAYYKLSCIHVHWFPQCAYQCMQESTKSELSARSLTKFDLLNLEIYMCIWITPLVLTCTVNNITCEHQPVLMVCACSMYTCMIALSLLALVKINHFQGEWWYGIMILMGSFCVCVGMWGCVCVSTVCIYVTLYRWRDLKSVSTCVWFTKANQ